MKKDSTLYFCSIITKSYLAYARTLAKSILEHHPESKVFVLLADRVNGYFDPNTEPFTLVTLEDLNEQEVLHKMCFYYTPFELCCALRAWLHQYMLEKTPAKKWIFLDSDIMVCSSLTEVFDYLNESSICLSPHNINPFPIVSPGDTQFARERERLLVPTGVFNGGFLGVNRTPETQKFVLWYKQHLLFESLQDFTLGYFGDQLWLSHVPVYFNKVSILKNAGANLAWWNLYERIIVEAQKGHITVNGQPLLFFHFSQFEVKGSRKLTAYPLIIPNETIPSGINDLAQNYRERLLKNGYEESILYPYAFSHFDSGEPITNAMRRDYRSNILQGVSNIESPFKAYKLFRGRLNSKNRLLADLAIISDLLSGVKNNKESNYIFRLLVLAFRSPMLLFSRIFWGALKRIGLRNKV